MAANCCFVASKAGRWAGESRYPDIPTFSIHNFPTSSHTKKIIPASFSCSIYPWGRNQLSSVTSGSSAWFGADMHTEADKISQFLPMSECLVYSLVELWTLAADRLAPGHLKGQESGAQEVRSTGIQINRVSRDKGGFLNAPTMHFVLEKNVTQQRQASLGNVLSLQPKVANNPCVPAFN